MKPQHTIPDEDERKFELMRELVERHIPFNQVLGFRLLEAKEGHAALQFDFKPELVGNYQTRVLHGGVISSALDVVGAAATMSSFSFSEPLRGMGTVDMRIDYLRPGDGQSFVATGTVMRPGRILASTRMELVNDEGELLAIGTAIYRVSSRDEEQDTMNV